MNSLEPRLERLTAEHGRAARHAALDLVLRALPDDVRHSFVDGLLAAAEGEPGILAELWRCYDPHHDATCGATWAQIRPGGVAIVWPTQWTRRLPSGIADPLLRALLASLREQGVTLAQSLLVDRTVPEAATLARCGFTHAADLRYLSATVDPKEVPAAHPADVEFAFVPVGAGDFARLAAIVEQTYLDTRDCPALDGLRNAGDVIDEYRTIGVGGERLWRIVERGGRDVGCLFMADHPSQCQAELVYMGVVKSERGAGGGAAMVRETLRMAASLGRERVILAVDADNAPAAAIYEHHGFTHIETRTVMICRLAPHHGDGR